MFTYNNMNQIKTKNGIAFEYDKMINIHLYVQRYLTQVEF